MISPKEKAKQLIKSYYNNIPLEVSYSKSKMTEHAKQCALICVDEILEIANLMDGGFSFEKEIKYWKQVKEEIKIYKYDENKRNQN